MLVFALVDLIMAMASPACLKITGRGRSSHLKVHYPERNSEKRWLGGHLPKMPTPSETMNLTTTILIKTYTQIPRLMHIQPIFDVFAISLLSLSSPR